MEHLPEVEKDSPSFHADPLTTIFLTHTNNVPNIELHSTVIHHLEEGKEPPSSNMTSNTSILWNLDIPNSISMERSDCFHYAEPLNKGLEHSVENNLFHYANPTFQYHIFTLQRQMLLDMGVLNEFEQFPNFCYPDIHLIPTRTFGNVRVEPNQQPSKRKIISKSTSNRFVIFKQPDAVQRRSYSKEKR